MKRHSALAPLSRDHHQSLVLAQRLRRGTDDTLTDIARMFLAHWQAEEQQHFRLEEEILLPAFVEHFPPHHPAILRTLVEHAEIRRDAVQLTVAPTLEVLRLIGVRLADHINFEEHELFPLIETALSEAELRTLGDRIDDGLPPPLHS